MRVIISRAARDDLTAIRDYIALDSPARAASFIIELIAACRAIGQSPFAWPGLSGFEAEGLRRAIHGRYLILYLPQPREIQIVRIVHGARDLDRLTIDTRSE